jgi:phosphoribosylformylglycinamidine synthase
MAFGSDVGFTVDLGRAPGADALTPAEICFSESTSRVVLSVPPDRVDDVLRRAGAARVPAEVLGVATGARLVAAGAFAVDLETATRTYREAIPAIMGAVRV